VSLGKATVKARGGVEQWLGAVESGMVSSLRRLAKAGVASYAEEPRDQWVQQPHNPSQLVIAVSQVGPGTPGVVLFGGLQTGCGNQPVWGAVERGPIAA
jgi:hypothetical protein